MSVDFTKLFGGGGGGKYLAMQMPFFDSRAWTVPQDGIIIVRALGAGGGGSSGPASQPNQTGGYSGSWGCKALSVSKGTVITVEIGAGGVWVNNASAGGGNTVITIGTEQYIAAGGPNGKSGATGPLPNGPSPSGNWDYGAASVRPGWVGNTPTGGAGVDIFAQGNNATASIGPAGGGTMYSTGILDSFGGGALPSGKSLSGMDDGIPGYLSLDGMGWGISFYGGRGGGSGGSGVATYAGPGGGGAFASSSSIRIDGGYGGGGGASTAPSSSGGIGGLGAGGGAAATNSSGGRGGHGYAFIQFFTNIEG